MKNLILDTAKLRPYFCSNQSSFMNDPLILGSIITLIVVVGIYLYFWRKERKMIKEMSATISSPDMNTIVSNQQKSNPNPNLLPLQLQAYERLTILAERIAIPNLLVRIPYDQLDTRTYENLLINHMRTEYDYNLSQQLYVSAEAWQAVTGLRDQNIFILNQVASGLNPGSSANEFVQMIYELLNKDSNVSMHPIVLEALQFEVRKLMSQAS